jgi:hypothetical protein
MKAHIVLSKNPYNRIDTLSELILLFSDTHDSFESDDCVKLRQDFESLDWDKQIFKGNELVQLLYDFPADLVSALKPTDKARVIFTDNDLSGEVINGRYTSHKLHTISSKRNQKASYALAHYIYCDLQAQSVRFLDDSEDEKKIMRKMFQDLAFQWFKNFIKVNTVKVDQNV